MHAHIKRAIFLKQFFESCEVGERHRKLENAKMNKGELIENLLGMRRKSLILWPNEKIQQALDT